MIKMNDLTNYYDEDTFEAFHALSPRPHWSDPIALDTAIESRASEILDLLSQTNTYIYCGWIRKDSGYAKQGLCQNFGF